MYESSHELPNDLREDLRKLGNFKKMFGMLGFNGGYLAGHPKVKFSRFR